MTAVAPLQAQSLADAARKAEEQRNATPGEGVTIPQPRAFEDGQPPRFTAELIGRYSDARSALTQLRRSDRVLHRRMLEATRGMHDLEEFERVLAAEPAAVNLLDTFGLTPAKYMTVELTIYRARDYQRDPNRVRVEETDRERENVRFLIVQSYLVQWVIDRANTEERNLQLWHAGYRPAIR